jgi:ABC-type anion transport system duplicated permease subunit
MNLTGRLLSAKIIIVTVVPTAIMILYAMQKKQKRSLVNSTAMKLDKFTRKSQRRSFNTANHRRNEEIRRVVQITSHGQSRERSR